MTPDELRALADALSRQRQADEHGIDCAVPRQAVDAAIKYLRAQADAQPVAWMYEHDGCVDTPLFTVNRWTKCEEPWNESPLFLHPAPAAPQAEPRVVASFYTEDAELVGTTHAPIKRVEVEDDGTLHVFIDHWPQPVPAGWKLVPVEPTPEMLQAGASIMDFDRSGWYDADVSRAEYRAMLAAAPAAPQAEPIDPHMIVAEDRFPDVPAERWKPCPQCGEDVDRECPICDGLGRVLATDSEQAEPKRKPLSDEQIDEESTNRQMTAACEDAFYDGVRWAEHSHGIGGSDAE
jgi:hypothetical protein